MRVHLRLVKVIITCKLNMIRRWNLHQLISFVESLKSLWAYGCKPWVTKLSIVRHTLGMLTANIVVMRRKGCRTSHVIITWHFAVWTAVEPLIHPAFISYSILLQAWQITQTFFCLHNHLPWNMLTLPEAMDTGATCVLMYLHVTIASGLAWVEHFWNDLLECVNESQVNACAV